MSGETYHSRIITAAKAKYETENVNTGSLSNSSERHSAASDLSADSKCSLVGDLDLPFNSSSSSNIQNLTRVKKISGRARAFGASDLHSFVKSVGR